MTEDLHILSGDQTVGAVTYNRKTDKVEWLYEKGWRDESSSFPASLSLPLSKLSHKDEVTRIFLTGLLPDNPEVLEAWGKRFHVSPRNPFDILKHTGEDCAGALQFVRDDRVDAILSGDLDNLIPLTPEEIASRIEDLRLQSKSVPVSIEGRFSLAGAQTKDALHLKDGQWFVPEGRVPSTHILKPQVAEFEEHALSEHFCLALAQTAGLPAAQSKIMFFDGEPVIAVKRYDRVRRDGKTLRIHQEDLCQALSVPPSRKYQNEGGPSPPQIIKLLDSYSDSSADDDIAQFLQALALNWAIAGTDAHAKNYSLLHYPGSFLKLAPLYDLASWLPYEKDPNSRKTKLPMKIGSTYMLHEIGKKQWESLAADSLLDPEHVLTTVRTFLESLLTAIPETRCSLEEAYEGSFVEVLSSQINAHAEHCLISLQ